MQVNVGLWQWALYVMLCVGTSENDESNAKRRGTYIEKRTKDFFLRYFHGKNNNSSAIRSFLENEVGVPSIWFEEALATTSAYHGDAQGYIAHLIASQEVEQATVAIERLIIPPSLMMGDESLLKLMHFLEKQRDMGLYQGK